MKIGLKGVFHPTQSTATLESQAAGEDENDKAVAEKAPCCL